MKTFHSFRKLICLACAGWAFLPAAAQNEWIPGATGNWNTASRWSVGVPNGNDARADLIRDPGPGNGNQIVNLDLNVVLNLLNIGESNSGNGNQSYTIKAVSNQTITLFNGASTFNPVLTKFGGATDTIDALLIVKESSNIDVNGGTLVIGDTVANSGLQVGDGTAGLKVMTKGGGATLTLGNIVRVLSDGRFDVIAGTTNINGLVNRFEGMLKITGGTVNMNRDGGVYSFTGPNAIEKGGTGTITIGPDTGRANFLLGGTTEILNGTLNFGRNGGAADVLLSAGDLLLDRGTVRLQNGDNTGGTTTVVGGALTTLNATSVSSNTITMASTAGLFTGMRVFGPGIPTGANIVSVTGTTITLDATPTSGADQVFMAAQGRQSVSVTGGSAGATTLTVTGGTSGFTTGMVVTGTGIPIGTVITDVSPTTITLSTPLTASTTAVSAFARSDFNMNSGAIEMFQNGNARGTVNLDPSIGLNLGEKVVITNIIGTMTAGNPVVPVETSAGMAVGMLVSGPGILPGTTVSAVNAAGTNTISLSLPPTSSGSGNVTLSLRSTFNFADNQGTIQHHTIYSLNSASDFSILRSNTNSSTLTVGNSSLVNDVFNGAVDFGGSSSRLIKDGSNTLTLGGIVNNNNARMTVNGGTLVLNKTSAPSINAVAVSLIIGDADTAIETVRIAGSSTVSSPGLTNYNDQIDRATDVTINATGVLDLNGFSEGFDELIGTGGLVTNTAPGTLSRLTIGEFNGSSTFTGNINAGASGTGQIELFKSGTGTINLDAANSFTGGTAIGGGTLALRSNGTLTGSGALHIAGGTLSLDNNSINNTDRVGSGPVQISEGGVIVIRNHTSSANSLNEVMGTLTVNSGLGVLSLNRFTNVTNTTRLSFSSLSLAQGAHLVVLEQSNGTLAGFATSASNASTVNSQVTFDTLPTLIGGGGGNGTPLISLLPNAFGGVKNNATGDFLTVQNLSGANYVRPLLSTEYATLASGSQDNRNTIAITDTTLTQNTFANALKVAIGASNSNINIQNGAILKLGGNTNAAHGALTIGTGMIVSSSTGSGVTSFLGGTLDFGSLGARIHANNNVAVYSTITSQAGLSKSGVGLLDLAGANSYTGETISMQQGPTAGVDAGDAGIRVLHSRALGATGLGNGTRLIQSGLMLSSGVTIGTGLADAQREDLTMEARTTLRAQSRSNTWFGNVNLAAATLTGNGSAISMLTRDNSTLTVMGDITGTGYAMNSTHFDAQTGRELRLIHESGAGNGLIFLNGAVSDRLGGSASAGPQETLGLMVSGQNTAGVSNPDFNVFINNANKVHGRVDLRSGVLHIGSGLGSDLAPGTADTLLLRLRNLATTDATEDRDQVAALLFNQPGSVFPVHNISWAENNQGYHSTSYGIIGADITSGKVTIGSGVGTLTLNPESDAGISFTRTSVTVTTNQPLINVGSTTGISPGMFINGTGIPAGAYVVRVVDASTVLINVNPTATNSGLTLTLNQNQRYADARLYARQGGELELNMRVVDDGGFSLDNAVGALTKIGRGTVVMGGSGGNGDLDAGVNLHGGTLVFDYSLNNTRMVSSGQTQAQITLAGGTLFLRGSSTNGGFTEEIQGLMFMRPGESTIRVQPSGLFNVTRLDLGIDLSLGNTTAGTNIRVREMPLRSAGATMNFWEDISLGGSSVINFLIPTNSPNFGADFSNFALPWALYADQITGGMEHFAAVDTNDTVKSALTVGGYDFVDNAANWKTLIQGTVTEDFSGFFGTTPVIDRNTDFFNNIRFSSNTTNTLTINSAGLQFQVDPPLGGFGGVLGGAILLSSVIDDPSVVKTINGGPLTSELEAPYYGTTTASRDLLIHNHMAGRFRIESNIANNIPGGTLTGPLNLVHGGVGLTQIVGAKTYTGRTFFNGGTLWVDNPNNLGTTPGTFDSGNWSFNGGVLRVAHFTDPMGTPVGGSGGFTMSSNRGITIGGNGAWIQLDNAGTRMTVGGLVVSEANAPEFAGGITRTTNLGVGDLILQGAGRLVLTNQGNNYFGLTEVRGGVLQANIGQISSKVLGSNITTIDGTIVEAGARLDLFSVGNASQAFSTDEWITLNGGTLGTVLGHVDASIDGLVTLNGNSRMAVDFGVLRLNRSSGVVRGGGNLTKSGTGTLILGQSNPLFSGQVNILEGIVMGTSQRLSMGTGSQIVLGNSSAVSSPAAALYLHSFSTAPVAFAGEYSVDQNIQVVAPLADGNPATFQDKRLGARAYFDAVTTMRGAQFDRFIFNGNIDLGDNLILSYGDKVANPAITSSGRDQVLVFNGGFSGMGNLQTEIVYDGNTIADQNDLRVFYQFNGNNSGWSGSLTAGNATADPDLVHILRMGGNNALGAANQVNMHFNTVLQAGGRTVQTGNVMIVPNGIATGNGAATAGIIIENADTTPGTFIINQTVNENWDALFRDGQFVGEFATPGQPLVSQPLTVVKTGSAVATMTQANTYTGGTQVGRLNGAAGGTLRVGVGASISSNSPITVFGGTLEFNVNHTANQVVTLGGGAAGTKASLQTGSSTLTINNNVVYNAANNPAGAELGGNVQMGAAQRTFTVADSIGAAIDLNVSANLMGTSTMPLIKTGPGTLALSGANTFSGGVSIQQGVLLANNTSGSATGSAAVTVMPGATLGGIGSIAGDVNLTTGVMGNGPMISVGSPVINSGLELLDLQGVLTLGEYSIIDFYLGQTGFTKLSVNTIGFVAPTTKFRVNIGSYTPNSGASFDILDWVINQGLGDTNWLDNLELPSGPMWDTSLFTTTGVVRVAGSSSPLIILSEPAPRTVDPGTPATFTIQLSGTEPWLLQWKKNGTPIPGATGLSYTIPFALEEDEGNYSVEATNGINTVHSLDALLTVNDIPVITTGPVGGTVNPGTNFTFNVVATGATSYQWKRNNVNIPGATSASYTINGVMKSHQGTYTVDAINAAGTATSNPVDLNVNDPVQIVNHPENWPVPLGAQVTFTVTATGTAPLQYQWRRNNVAIPGATGSSYTVTLNSGNAGNYTVAITNVVSVTPVVSNPGVLSEVAAPVNIITQPQPRIVAQGGTLTLNCLAVGALPLKYQWRKNGANIAGATSPTLVINNVTSSRAGVYTCFVTNVTAGGTTSELSNPVDVAVVNTAPRTLVLKEGTNTTLSVSAFGNVSFQWYKDSGMGEAMIAGETGSTLALTGLALADKANYFCRVTLNGTALTLDGGINDLTVFNAAPDIDMPGHFPPTIVSEPYNFKIPLAEISPGVPDPAKTPTKYVAVGLPPGLKIDSNGNVTGRATAPRYVNGVLSPYLVKITASNSFGSDVVVDRQLMVAELPGAFIGVFTGSVERNAALTPGPAGTTVGLGGRIDLTTTKTGTYSGKVLLGTSTYSFKGALDTDESSPNQATVTVEVKRGKLPSLTLSFTLDATDDLLKMGTLTDGIDTAMVSGWRNKWVKTLANPVPAGDYQGYYTFGLDIPLSLVGTAANEGIPQGSGFGSFTVSGATAKLNIAGRLADGTAYTSATFVGPTGQLLIFRTLYAANARGSILGTMNITLAPSNLDNTVGNNPGDLDWWRPATPGTTARLYKNGFDPLTQNAAGSRYTAPVSPFIVMNITNVPAGVTNARLSFVEAFINDAQGTNFLDVNVSSTHRVTPVSSVFPRVTSMTIVARTGALTAKSILADPHPDLANGGLPATVKRTASGLGMIVRDGAGIQGIGYFLLQKLPATKAEPATKTDILSGQFLFDKFP